MPSAVTNIIYSDNLTVSFDFHKPDLHLQPAVWGHVVKLAERPVCQGMHMQTTAGTTAGTTGLTRAVSRAGGRYVCRDGCNLVFSL